MALAPRRARSALRHRAAGLILRCDAPRPSLPWGRFVSSPQKGGVTHLDDSQRLGHVPHRLRVRSRLAVLWRILKPSRKGSRRKLDASALTWRFGSHLSRKTEPHQPG
jgi:hypothetical protein